jgi:hypothetical protein
MMIRQHTLIRLAQLALLLAVTACAGTRQQKRLADNVLITHDVRNLILTTDPDAKPTYESIDILVQNIKSATSPAYWNTHAGTSIKPIEGGYLLVNAGSPMQQRVAAFLDDLDQFGDGAHRKNSASRKKG